MIKELMTNKFLLYVNLSNGAGLCIRIPSWLYSPTVIAEEYISTVEDVQLLSTLFMLIFGEKTTVGLMSSKVMKIIKRIKVHPVVKMYITKEVL